MYERANGVHHMRGAPYHPATNGEAERFVQTFKQSLKRGKEDDGTMEQKLAQFLIMNHTGVPPAELFMKRQLRTRLDVLRPSVKNHVVAKQQEQQSYHDKRACDRSLDPGQQVLAKNWREGPQWVCGRILRRDGPVSYQVEIGSQVWKRHVDQLWAYRGMEEVPAQVGEPSAQLDESSLTEDPTEAPGIPDVQPDSQPTEAHLSSPEPVVPGEEEGAEAAMPPTAVGPTSSPAATPPSSVKTYPLRGNQPPPGTYKPPRY